MSHPSEWKFICPECGEEANPAPVTWIHQDKFEYIEVRGILFCKYYMNCQCYNHNRGRWPYFFNVELTKEQARAYEYWKQEKNKPKLGKVIE